MEARFVVAIPEWVIPNWWVVAYKIPPPLGGEMLELAQIRPDERFEKVVARYLAGVVNEGKMPPMDIAPAILNLANDFAAGREITIRTGDYIAIQNHIRRM